jgi:hypothetical protein
MIENTEGGIFSFKEVKIGVLSCVEIVFLGQMIVVKCVFKKQVFHGEDDRF